jgi:hypothetical protein
VVKAAFVRVADIHPGPFPNGFQTFQFVNLSRVVFLALTDAGGFGLAFPIIRIFVVWKAQSSGWHIRPKR